MVGKAKTEIKPRKMKRPGRRSPGRRSPVRS